MRALILLLPLVVRGDWWGTVSRTTRVTITPNDIGESLSTHMVMCEAGKALTGWKMDVEDGGASFEYKCADLPSLHNDGQVHHIDGETECEPLIELVYFDRHQIGKDCVDNDMALHHFHLTDEGCAVAGEYKFDYGCAGARMSVTNKRTTDVCQPCAEANAADLEDHSVYQCAEFEFLADWRMIRCLDGNGNPLDTCKVEYTCALDKVIQHPEYEQYTISQTAADFHTDNGYWQDGQFNCTCVGSDVDEIIPDDAVQKGTGYGFFCNDWDEEADYCEDTPGNRFNKPWCTMRWCYVHESCRAFYDETEDNGKKSVVFDNVDNLYWSYLTCENHDLYNGEWIWSSTPCTERPGRDVYFLMDTSKSVIPAEQEYMNSFITKMMEELTGSGDNRYAVGQFGGSDKNHPNAVQQIWTFKDWVNNRNDPQVLYDRLDNIVQVAGQTHLNKGLKLAIEEFESWDADVDNNIARASRNMWLVIIMDSDAKPASEAPCDAQGDIRGSTGSLMARLNDFPVKSTVLRVGNKVTEDGKKRLECLTTRNDVLHPEAMVDITSFTTFFDYTDPSDNEDLCLSPTLFLPKLPTSSPTQEPTNFPTSSPTFDPWCNTNDYRTCVQDFKCRWAKKGNFCKVGTKFKCTRWANYQEKKLRIRVDKDRCESAGSLGPFLEEYGVEGCKFKPKKKKGKQCRGKFSFKAIAPPGSPGGDNNGD